MYSQQAKEVYIRGFVRVYIGEKSREHGMMNVDVHAVKCKLFPIYIYIYI